METIKFYWRIIFGQLRIYSKNPQHKILNNYLGDSVEFYNREITELHTLRIDPEKIISKYWGWEEDEQLGYVGFMGGNDAVTRAYREGIIYLIDIIDHSGYLQFTLDELESIFIKARNYYIKFERPESFPTFQNMLSLVNKRYAKKLEGLGFRCVGQTPDMVRFVKDWLFIDLLEDRDGAVLFFTDQRNGQRYEFNMALELLDWDAGNMHSLLCQKYMRKMSREEARTAIMEITFQYVESHFKDLLQGPDEDFFRRLESERQLRTEMLKKVLIMPKENIIHQMFLNDNPVWWEYMREEMGKA